MLQSVFLTVFLIQIYYFIFLDTFIGLLGNDNADLVSITGIEYN